MFSYSEDVLTKYRYSSSHTSRQDLSKFFSHANVIKADSLNSDPILQTLPLEYGDREESHVASLSWMQQNRTNRNLFLTFLLILIVSYHQEYFILSNKSHLHHSQEFLIVHANRPYSNICIGKRAFWKQFIRFCNRQLSRWNALKAEGQTFCFNLTYLNLYEGKDLGFYKASWTAIPKTLKFNNKSI